MSGEEIASLKEFGRRYDKAVRREDWKETYPMLDEPSQKQFTEQEWAEKQQALADADGPLAPLERVTIDQDKEVADSPATVILWYEDETQNALQVLLPMAVSSAGADSTEPKLHLPRGEISYLKGFGENAASKLEAEVKEAVQQYYYAVDYKEWKYAYYNLDSESKALFTQEEWIEKNQWYADDENSKLESMDIDVRMEGDKEASVTVHRTFKNGYSLTRDTTFVYENGWWRHHLTEKEQQIFRPDLSYEQFVEAQQ